MTGMEMFESYFTEGDVFVWSRFTYNVPILCVITNIRPGADNIRCNTARKDSRLGWDHSTGTLCKLKENTPHVYKLVEDYLEREWEK